MRNILFLLLVIIGCRGIPVEPVKQESLVVPSIMEGTVALIDEGETSPYCTGIWISGDHILTAHHCVVNSMQEVIEKIIETGEEPKIEDLLTIQYKKIKYINKKDVQDIFIKPEIYRDAILVGIDADSDLALLKAKENIYPHEVINITEKIQIAERVHIVGHVQGLSWTYMEGVVSAERIKDGVSMLQISAPVYFGASGGGAFNKYGELVGLTSFIYKAPNIGFFIDAKTIKKFLKNHLIIK